MPQQVPLTSVPNDNEAYRFPVSIKGVVIIDSRAVLLKNSRNEWELPGGKLELGETPPVCLAREVREELILSVKVGPILDSWVYHIAEGVDVLIVTYGCHLDVTLSHRENWHIALNTRLWDYSPRMR